MVLTNETTRPNTVVSSATTNVSGAGDGSHTHRRVSWGAIFGGVVIVVAIQLLLSLLGAGIGLNTVNTNAADSMPTASSYGLGAGLWWVISGIISLVIGGYVAAWLAGIEVRFDGVLHGLITWGIATLLTIYLLSSAVGSILGGGFSMLGSAASTAGSGIKSAAQAAGVSPDMIQQQAQAFTQPTNRDVASMNAQDAQKEVAMQLVTYGRGGSDAAPAKERIISIMAAQQKISHDDAAKQFNDGEAKMKQARDQAIQTAKNTADASASAVSHAAFAGFVNLLLGALAAAIGGSMAVQRRTQHVTTSTHL